MSGKETTFRQRDTGRDVSVDLGSRIVVRLPENPTTGFRWVGDDPAGLVRIGDANERSSGAPAAGGVRVLVWKVTHAGRIELRLRHCQAWEPNPATDTDFELVIQAE